MTTHARAQNKLSLTSNPRTVESHAARYAGNLYVRSSLGTAREKNRQRGAHALLHAPPGAQPTQRLAALYLPLQVVVTQQAVRQAPDRATNAQSKPLLQQVAHQLARAPSRQANHFLCKAHRLPSVSACRTGFSFGLCPLGHARIPCCFPVPHNRTFSALGGGRTDCFRQDPAVT